MQRIFPIKLTIWEKTYEFQRFYRFLAKEPFFFFFFFYDIFATKKRYFLYLKQFKKIFLTKKNCIKKEYVKIPLKK